MAASRCSQIIVRALVAGMLGLTPGLALAQSNPFNPAPAPSTSSSSSPPDANMVARCDMPVLDLFNPTPGDMVVPGDYTISGVAVDPLAQNGSGIDSVSFYLGPRDQGGVALGDVAPSGGLRQDDFSLSVQLPEADPGTQQQLVGYAHAPSGDKTTELSVPIVIGGDDSHPTVANPSANTINTNPGTVPADCAGSTAVAVPDVLTGGTPGGNQAVTSADTFGTVVGNVSQCSNGAEQPATLVTVQVDGTPASTETDENGDFALTQVPAPGSYTISVSDSGASAERMYVPVAPGESIDIGTLELGANPAMGCGDEDQGQGP